LLKYQLLDKLYLFAIFIDLCLPFQLLKKINKNLNYFFIYHIKNLVKVYILLDKI